MSNYPQLPTTVTWFTKSGDYVGPCRTCKSPVHYHIGKPKQSCGETYRPINHVTCRKCGHSLYAALYHHKTFNAIKAAQA